MALRNRGWRTFAAVALLTLLLLAGLAFPLASAQAGSIFNPTAPAGNMPSVALPEVADFSFSDLPSFSEAGGIDFGAIDPSLIDRLGYDPSVFWKAGDHLESILDLGTLAPYTTLANWSLNTISGFVPGARWASIPLSAAVFLSNHSIEDIVDAVPLLGGYRLGEVRPIYDFLASELGWNPIQGGAMARLPLRRIADSVFGTVKFDLGEFDFEKYLISDVPNLDSMPFSNLVDWEKIKLGDIPFLDVVRWGSFGLGIVDLLTTAVARVDVVFGDAEGNQKERGRETVTGSYREGFAVPCDEESCSYLELTDVIDLGSLPGLPSVHGKQWISGKSQKVMGGSGFLVGEEPTGRNPFGPVFKVVMTDVSESEGKATFSLYFRLCFSFFGISACTPYILGPFPWFPASEGEIIVLGLDGGEGDAGSSGGGGLRPSREELEKLLREKNPEFAGKIERIAGQQPDYGEPGYYEDAVDTGASCSTYKGVHMGYLRQAIANVESLGSGDYRAVGEYVIADGGRNRGRALGKYQIMSYEPEIVRYVGSRPGGREFLARISGNEISVSEMQETMRTLFPPALQEKVVEEQFKRRINDARRKVNGGSEREVVYHLAGWYNPLGGGLNRGYAKRVTDYYFNNGLRAGVNGKCRAARSEGGCAGKLIVPTSGRWTSGYGNRVHPIHGDVRMHRGVDIGAPTGTPVRAADGGVVIYRGWIGGYGNVIQIRHCNGWVTWYCHLHTFQVSLNQRVSQGQIIATVGSTGGSTGPHLHFELHVSQGRQPVDPEKHLPKIPGSPRP
jgi:murein DD-endopeptidase MepM/ murein hydrolase activator NlpD